MEDEAESVREPVSHGEMRRRWAAARREQGGGGATGGPQRLRIILPPWAGHALLVVFLGGFLVALAALLSGSILVWYGMFAVLGGWLVRGRSLPWWAGAAVALAALPVANHSLAFLVTHGGLGMIGAALRLGLSSIGTVQSGRGAVLVPVALGAAGGFLAAHVEW